MGPRAGQEVLENKNSLAPAGNRAPDIVMPAAVKSVRLPNSSHINNAFRIPASQSCVYGLEFISLVELKAVDTETMTNKTEVKQGHVQTKQHSDKPPLFGIAVSYMHERNKELYCVPFHVQRYVTCVVFTPCSISVRACTKNGVTFSHFKALNLMIIP